MLLYCYWFFLFFFCFNPFGRVWARLLGDLIFSWKSVKIYFDLHVSIPEHKKNSNAIDKKNECHWSKKKRIFRIRMIFLQRHKMNFAYTLWLPFAIYFGYTTTEYFRISALISMIFFLNVSFLSFFLYVFFCCFWFLEELYYGKVRVSYIKFVKSFWCIYFWIRNKFFFFTLMSRLNHYIYINTGSKHLYF